MHAAIYAANSAPLLNNVLLTIRGFGFVSFDTSDQMENLLLTHKDNPVIIDGHTVNIKRVFPESVGIISLNY